LTPLSLSAYLPCAQILLVIRAGGRERKEIKERFNALIDAQIRTDERLDRLAATVEKHIEGGE
jgi:hypothetical protein